MSRNQAVAAAFGAQLDPPVVPVQVRNINGIPRRDAWMIAMFDVATDVGITAHVYGSQQLHAFVEVLGGSEDAGRVSRMLAGVVKALKDDRTVQDPENNSRSGFPEGFAETAEGGAAEGHPESGSAQDQSGGDDGS